MTLPSLPSDTTEKIKLCNLLTWTDFAKILHEALSEEKSNDKTVPIKLLHFTKYETPYGPPPTSNLT